MTRARSAVAVAILLAARPAVAANADQAVRELTLDQALELGKKRNKSMAAERAKLEQAQTSLSSAWALLLPWTDGRDPMKAEANAVLRSKSVRPLLRARSAGVATSVSPE